jgi:putative DNA primase/helicase
MTGANKKRRFGAQLSGHIETVATELYGEPTGVSGTQLRYRGKGGLHVDTEEQVFYDFESARGGGVLQLIQNACEGDNASAIDWVQKFLDESHELPARRNRADHQDDDWKRNLALEIFEKQLPAEGTSAEAYLTGRGITDPELVAQVGFLPNIREDDDALVSVVTDDDGNPVAVHLTYITSGGAKSSLAPVRLTFSIDPQWSTKGGVRFAGDGDSILCEGVEDAMSCAQVTGRPAIAALGVSNLGKYVPDDVRLLTICLDGDDPESAAAKGIPRACDNLLLGGVNEVLVARLLYDEENERKIDANDVLREHGPKALQEIIKAAEPARLSYKGEIRLLAAMGLDECAEQIKPSHEAMKKRGIKVTLRDFRDAVRRARTDVEAEQPSHTRITSMAPPSPTLMKSGDLLQRINKIILKYVIIDENLALLVALYVMYTHIFKQFDCCPRLMITAPTRAAGKTRLASVIGPLCAWPLSSSNATVAALFRVIESEAPTLIIGEFDTFMKQSEDHRNIINSGHYREEAFVLRTVGEDFEPKRFSTFAPMIFSGIGDMHRTVMSRAIIIPMRRRLEHEEIARFDRKARETLPIEQGLISRWALDFGEKIGNFPIPPPIPELDDRANDNAEPLLVIAQDCGEELETRARAALLKAYKAANLPGDDDLNILALYDLRDTFVEKNQAHSVGVVFTAEVLGHMCLETDRPWGEMPKTGRPITANKLGWLLKGFALNGGRVTRDGERHRGFRWELCEDTFARYLGPLSEADASDATLTPGPTSTTPPPPSTDDVGPDDEVL